MTKSYDTVLTIIIVPLTLFPLSLLLIVSLGVYTVNLCSIIACNAYVCGQGYQVIWVKLEFFCSN
jgi:hypothetical protein